MKNMEMFVSLQAESEFIVYNCNANVTTIELFFKIPIFLYTSVNFFLDVQNIVIIYVKVKMSKNQKNFDGR